MERGPLPPHERTWRHPSELAAEERELVRAQAAAPSTRVFALTTGTLGLIAVGVLILAVTPRRQESPIAISATTTPAAVSVVGSSDPGSVRPAALAPTFVGRGTTTTVATNGQHAWATPIDEGIMAIVTREAMTSLDATRVEVLLPSGRVGLGEIIGYVGDALLIELQESEPGHRVANGPPGDAEIVTVMASPPVTIAFADVGTLDLHEGTAVLDSRGDLVGICSHDESDGRVRVIEINADLVDATNDGQ